jgi:hypothetical protein
MIISNNNLDSTNPTSVTTMDKWGKQETTKASSNNLNTNATISTSSTNDECDYLVIGGGATGMAFSDTLLGNSKKPLRVIIVDEHSAPGGQWNDSYDFVQLHQPSKMYMASSQRNSKSRLSIAQLGLSF